MKTLHFVRHGSVHNPEGIVYGRLPGFYLSGKGFGEAMDAAAVLREMSAAAPIKALHYSPLERTSQTAQAIANNLWKQSDKTERINPDKDLLECEQVFEGQRFPSAEVLKKPSNWKYLRNPYKPSWGESYQSIFNRMQAAADYALSQIEDGEAAVLVGHQLPIVTYRRGIENQSFFHDPALRECDPASITTVFYSTHGDALGVGYSRCNNKS